MFYAKYPRTAQSTRSTYLMISLLKRRKCALFAVSARCAASAAARWLSWAPPQPRRISASTLMWFTPHATQQAAHSHFAAQEEARRLARWFLAMGDDVHGDYARPRGQTAPLSPTGKRPPLTEPLFCRLARRMKIRFAISHWFLLLPCAYIWAPPGMPQKRQTRKDKKRDAPIS